MKWICAFAAIFIHQAVQAQPPVAYWKFEAISDSMFIRDESGHGFDLVAVSKKSTLLLTDGAVGKALKLKEPGYHILVAESDGKFNFSWGSIEAVVLYRPSPYPTTQLIFSNTTFMPGIAEGWDFNILTGGLLSFNTGNTSRPNGEPWNILKSPEFLVEGLAFHLAATWNDNGVNKIFINGRKVAFKPFITYSPSKDLCRFGYHIGDVKIGSWLYSDVDEIKIYDRPLSEVEILNRYNELKPGIEKLNGTVGLGNVSGSPQASAKFTLEPITGGLRLSVGNIALRSAVILDLQGRTLLNLYPEAPVGDIVVPRSFKPAGQVRIHAVGENGQTLGSLVNLRP